MKMKRYILTGLVIVLIGGGLFVLTNYSKESVPQITITPTIELNNQENKTILKDVLFQQKKEITENFIKTNYYYKSYIEPLQFLAHRKDNSDKDEFLYSFKIKYGDGREENRYFVIKIKDKVVVVARMFYDYSRDYMLEEFNLGKLLNPDCPYTNKEQCYKSFDIFLCGGEGDIGCSDGYICAITPCQTTDCQGLCKPE